MRFTLKTVLLYLFVLLCTACADERPPQLTELLPLPTVLPTSTLAATVSAESSPAPVATPTRQPTPIPTAIPEHEAEKDTPPVNRAINATDVVMGMWQGEAIGYWHYAAAVPFFDLRKAISLDEVRALWTGAGAGALVVSPQTEAIFEIEWGKAAEQVEVLDSAEISTRLWQRDGAIALVPFDLLEANIKPLMMDEMHLFDRVLEPADWPLAVPIGLNGDSDAIESFKAQLATPPTNRNVNQMTTVALTGVTALVRATAYAMEQNGLLWPGEEVREVLRAADIAHISNEVAFVPDCPYPNPIGGTTFCSDNRYFELLEDIGTDVMELTGNHVNDYGAANFATSIALYKEAGMQVYGGGIDAEAATVPAIFEHNGNRIVFHGCNSFGPPFSWAGNGNAGSRNCDARLKEQIGEDSADSIVITTLQYTEFYQYGVPWQQQVDFRSYADAGADIVSGSQGHHVQAFELYDESFIHYGPGNLFFDQMNMLGTRQTFIDEYIIYDGRLLGVRLHTFLIEEYARPRVMTAQERASALETVFSVSITDRP